MENFPACPTRAVNVAVFSLRASSGHLSAKTSIHQPARALLAVIVTRFLFVQVKFEGSIISL